MSLTMVLSFVSIIVKEPAFERHRGEVMMIVSCDRIVLVPDNLSLNFEGKEYELT